MSARERILEAADSLFGELGFDATSTRLIGERSGLNKALIHYHFKSKQDVFACLLDRYYERLNGVLRQALSGDGNVRDRLGRLLDAYADFLQENQSFSRMVQREVSGGRLSAHIGELMAPLFELGAGLVQAAFPATRGGDLAASQLMISFYGMVVSYFAYAPVLGGLLGADPTSPSSLSQRKAHIQRMMDLVLAELTRNEEP